MPISKIKCYMLEMYIVLIKQNLSMNDIVINHLTYYLFFFCHIMFQ